MPNQGIHQTAEAAGDPVIGTWKNIRANKAAQQVL
jgi:hypothetical protein